MEDAGMNLIELGVVFLSLGGIAVILFVFEMQISGNHRRRLKKNASRGRQ